MHAKALLTAATACVLAACVASSGEKKAAEEKTSARVAATVLRIDGSVNFKRAGKTKYQALALTTRLHVKDEVETAKKSSVELKLADGARITLGAESSLVIKAVRARLKADATLLDLDGGALGVTLDKPLAGRQRFEVATPVAVCGVRGTRFGTEHRNPRGGRKGNKRGRTSVTVGTGNVNVKCRNPLFAAHPGLNVGRNGRIGVSWDGFDQPQPAKVSKRHLRGIKKKLPGWVPNPMDPNMLKPLKYGPGVGSRRPGSGRGLGRLRFGKGPYARNGGGFHNAIGRAIMGNIGLSRGTAMGNLLGGESSGGPGGAGKGGGSKSPVGTVPVRPGQPTSPPPSDPPPSPPPPSRRDPPVVDDVIVPDMGSPIDFDADEPSERRGP